VGENGAEKAFQGKTDDNARGRADKRDARGDPQHVLARAAERQPYAEFRGALRLYSRTPLNVRLKVARAHLSVGD
jgi:hypothetical protein